MRNKEKVKEKTLSDLVNSLKNVGDSMVLGLIIQSAVSFKDGEMDVDELKTIIKEVMESFRSLTELNIKNDERNKNKNIKAKGE